MNVNSFIDTHVLVYCYTDDEAIKKQKALEIANVPDVLILLKT